MKHMCSRGDMGEGRDCSGKENFPVPGPSLASLCRSPPLLFALADLARNRGPNPAALSNPLFTEGRGCLEP